MACCSGMMSRDERPDGAVAKACVSMGRNVLDCRRPSLRGSLAFLRGL
jgi:hypothetical protein